MRDELKASNVWLGKLYYVSLKMDKKKLKDFCKHCGPYDGHRYHVNKLTGLTTHPALKEHSMYYLT